MKIYFENKLNESILKEDWSQGIIAEFKITNESIDEASNTKIETSYGRERKVFECPAIDEDDLTVYDLAGKENGYHSYRYYIHSRNDNWVGDYGWIEFTNHDFSTIIYPVYDNEIKYEISGGISTLKKIANGELDKNKIKENYSWFINILKTAGLNIVSAEAKVYLRGSNYGNPTFTVDLL